MLWARFFALIDCLEAIPLGLLLPCIKYCSSDQ